MSTRNDVLKTNVFDVISNGCCLVVLFIGVHVVPSAARCGSALKSRLVKTVAYEIRSYRSASLSPFYNHAHDPPAQGSR